MSPPEDLREWGIENDIIKMEDHEAALAKKKEEQDRIRRLTIDRLFDHDKPPDKPKPLFTINDQCLATVKNIESVSAQAKQGKSALLSAMIASWMRPDQAYLGIKCDHGGSPGALVHFDTEQSPYDHWWICENAMRRADAKQQPEGLYSAHIMDLPFLDRAPAIRLLLEDARKIHGKIFCVFIDGLADLCRNVNDIDECVALREWAQMLAVEFNTAIFCVIHENEGSDNAKMRGHLGSEIARKTESNIRLKKDEEGLITLWSEKSRHLHLTKTNGPRFIWDEETGMHQLVDPSAAAASKKTSKTEGLRALAQECFRNDGGIGLTYSQLRAELVAKMECSPRTAERKIGELRSSNIVYERMDKYHLK